MTAAQSVMIMAVVIVTASIGSARGAARDTGIRHRRQRAADTSLRRTDTEHYSIFSSAKQYHQASQHRQPQQLAHLMLPFLWRRSRHIGSDHCFLPRSSERFERMVAQMNP